MEHLIAVALLGGLTGMSEPVPAFYGCEVMPIEGTNAFQFVDPTCAAAVTQNTADYELVEVLDAQGQPTGDFVSVPTNNK